MNPKVLPAPREPRSPIALSLQEALGRSEPLAALGARLRESTARLEAIRPRLPPGLERQVSAGPVDDTGWTLMVSSPAVSAKLRQLKPLLEQVLREAGWPVSTIRIKVRHPDPAHR